MGAHRNFSKEGATARGHGERVLVQCWLVTDGRTDGETDT